jgi:hypothetical protein
MRQPMKRPTTSAAAGLVLLLAAAVRLSGQGYQPFREEAEMIRQEKKLRLGPLRIVPVIRLYDVGYDSNIYYANERQEPLGDFTATLSPEVRAHWLVGGSLILSAMENPEYIAYAREAALRTFSNSFSSGLRWLALRRFSLSAEYHDLSHVRRVQSEFDHRIRDTSTGAEASLFYETARGTAVGISGGMEDFRYEDVTSGVPNESYGRALDRRETRASLEVYYRVFSRSYFFSSVTWKSYVFSHEDSAWRDASSIDVSGGFRFPLVGLARGTVRFGWKSFRPDSPLRPSFSGLVAGTSVSFRRGRIGLTLGFDRDNVFSYLESAYYYVDTRGRAGLSLYLLRSLRIDARVAYGTMLYPEPQEVWVDGVPVVVDDREDVHVDVSFGPVVRIFRTAGLGLTFNIYRRTSNAPGYNVRRDFVGAFVTYEF